MYRDTNRLFGVVLWFAAVPLATAAVISEGFNNVSNLPASGWALINNSTGPGATGWFQGNPGSSLRKRARRILTSPQIS